MSIRHAVHETPLGWLLGVASETGLRSLSFLDEPPPVVPSREGETPELLARVFESIDRYMMDGRLPGGIDFLPEPVGTPFQQRVWTALRAIPDGRTTTYGELANELGLSATHARAIGTACAANPVAILIPCHRVLPTAGGLGGYRWGLARKRALLDLEAPALFALREPACPPRLS